MLFTFFIPWLVGSAAFTAPRAPPLQIEPGVIDFGDVEMDGDYVAPIEIRNSSPGSIHDWQFHSSCNCLSGSGFEALESREVARSAVHLRPCAYAGDVTKGVWFSASAGSISKPIPVHYRVVPAVYSDPPVVHLGLLASEGRTEELRIKTVGTRSVKVLAVVCPDTRFQCSIEENQCDATHSARITVGITGPQPEGAIRTSVCVLTDCVEQPEVVIPIDGQVIEGIWSEAAAPDIGAIPFRGHAKATARLHCEPGVQILDIRAANEAASVQSVQIDGEVVSVAIEVRKSNEIGRFEYPIFLEVFNGHRWQTRWNWSGQVIASQEPDVGPMVSK